MALSSAIRVASRSTTRPAVVHRRNRPHDWRLMHPGKATQGLSGSAKVHYRFHKIVAGDVTCPTSTCLQPSVGPSLPGTTIGSSRYPLDKPSTIAKLNIE